MLKIVVSPDSFKGSISAVNAAQAIKSGLLDGFGKEKKSQIILLPIADGGEGTLETLTKPSCRTACPVCAPDKKTVMAEYGYIGNTAVIETARAAGLTLVKDNQRSAYHATTYGVGELILSAINDGFRKILLTLGGSATNDGGCGMLAALGVKFYDYSDSVFVPTGGTLSQIKRIDFCDIYEKCRDCIFTIATDVKNPLLGENGATYVYAPQKGANAIELDEMEKGMKHYSDLLKQATGKEVADISGCGAAGGMATPLLALFDGKIESGISAVLKATDFETKLTDTDLVITGEGKFDNQSLCGKAMSGVAQVANAHGVPVYAFVGCIDGDVNKLMHDAGLKGVTAISDFAVSKDDSIKNAESYLYKAARIFAEKY